MSAAKRRVTISPDHRVFAALEALAEARSRTTASVTLELVERALELDEDAHFSRVGDARLARDEKRVSQNARVKETQR